MVDLVWFKRDLRVRDHAALSAVRGPVIALLIVEPSLWRLPDAAARHWQFFEGAGRDLAEALGRLGIPLTLRVGEAVPVLADLVRRHGVTRLLAHEETGNAATFARDRAVRRFCREAGVRVEEFRQFGVFRGPLDRDQWQRRHHAVMSAPVLPVPQGLTAVPDVASDPWPTAASLHLADDGLDPTGTGFDAPQPAGRAEALGLLTGFLAGRGHDYRRAMSSPLGGASACSRLSPHLALGSLSIRETLHRVESAHRDLAALPFSERPVPLTALEALTARLHWHCHFIQKLEAEPELEVRALHPFHEAARRPTAPDDPRLKAFAEGRTGFPFVDACMRALTATGWLNFRMRAMLQAFAAYHLSLDFVAAGQVLARRFIDYEPGIHWPQVQMQSGMTGINTPRIYNPVKQGHDQDPDGRFVRRWVPELRSLGGALVHEPWRLGGVPDYPSPVIDHEAAARAARDRLTALRHQPGYREEALAVYLRHGSRARRFEDDDPPKTRARLATKAAPARQLSLDL